MRSPDLNNPAGSPTRSHQSVLTPCQAYLFRVLLLSHTSDKGGTRPGTTARESPLGASFASAGFRKARQVIGHLLP